MAKVLLWNVIHLQVHVKFLHVSGNLGTVLQTQCSLSTWMANTTLVEILNISFYDLLDENHMPHYVP